MILVSYLPNAARFSFLRLFLYFSYTSPILFLGLKREEKEGKSEEKPETRKRIPTPACLQIYFIISRRIKFLLLKCDFHTRQIPSRFLDLFRKK